MSDRVPEIRDRGRSDSPTRLKMDAEDLGLYTTDLASYPQADPETEGI